MSDIWTTRGCWAAQATCCCSQVDNIGATPKALAPLVLQDAARKASTNRPITSSMTAAPRITEASGVVIFPASINVRAEMETLVAVSAPPRKHALGQERPSICAAPAPRKKGQITPDRATRK